MQRRWRPFLNCRIPSGGIDPWLLAVLVVSVLLCTYQLGWGLPNGNHSWAADALGPLTVLNIARRSLTSWNSGWFYFKYPLGYPFLLLTVYVPYLGLLALTGQFQQPTVTYPHGFSDPETALHVMALLGRGVSGFCVVATVALTYGIGRRLFGRAAGVLAACFAATAYPVVYYAHSTNLDAAYLFWLTLALWATVVACEADARWPYAVLGLAAAMAVSTKEQGFAFLLPLPVIIAATRQRALAAAVPAWKRWLAAVWNRRTRAGLVLALVAFVVVNNVVLNPSGFVNRVRYLSGQRLPGATARLAPVEFALFKGVPKEWQYLRQLFDGIESSLGLPLFVVAVVGVVYVACYRPRAAAVLLGPAAVHYYLSLRTLDLIALRYTLPLSVVLVLCGAALCARAWAVRPWLLGRFVVVGLCLLALARAVELDLVLRHDSRYRAEEWMQREIRPAATIETYQKPAYLPRFAGVTRQAVPMEQRTRAGIEQRRPDYVVISSAAKKGITHRWNPDWRQGHTLLVAVPGAVDFLRALESGRLPYTRAARFSQEPVLFRSRITSLCPEISIYQRVPQ